MIKPGTFCCAVKEKRVQKRGEAMWFYSQTGDTGKQGGGEEAEKKVPAPKKTPEGSRPNGNEPQGLLCFTGCSSACENL